MNTGHDAGQVRQGLEDGSKDSMIRKGLEGMCALQLPQRFRGRNGRGANHPGRALRKGDTLLHLAAKWKGACGRNIIPTTETGACTLESADHHACVSHCI